MFDRIRKANPENVYFEMVDGLPCFWIHLAIMKTLDEKHQYSEKQRTNIAKEIFEIEESKKKYAKAHPDKKYWWEVVEGNEVYYLRFYPTLCDQQYEKAESMTLKQSWSFLGKTRSISLINWM